jgi:peptide/nickel transport system substrate-binding protein
MAALVGCGSNGQETTPVRDVLRIGVPESTGGGPNVGMRELTNGLSLEGLTQVGIDGKAVPRLAARWTWENDYRSLRITLRPGVKLHDGTSPDAESVAAALRNQVNRPGNRALYPSFTDITEIRADGQQLVIDLSRRSAFLPEDLDLSLGIGPNNLGTGPYRPMPSESSDVVLERFNDYYLGAPQIRSIVIRPFDTLRTAWTSLLRDDLDFVTDVPPDAVEFIRNDDIQVISFARWYQYLIAFNSRKAPLTSPLVRRALNLAVDRQALIKSVLQERGAPSTGPLWPRYWAYDSSVAAYGFDPTRAGALLDEAGYQLGAAASTGEASPARLRFTCLIPAGFSIWERMALEIQKYLYNVGVDMQFEVVPFREFDARIREGRFDAALVDAISGPTPSRAYIFWQSERRHKGLNVFGYDNPDAERLFEVLRTDTNEGAVRSATRRLQSVLLDDPPALFLAWSQRARAVRRDFQIVQEQDSDPMLTMWRWAPASSRGVATQ